jgi:hypothetical protein
VSKGRERRRPAAGASPTNVRRPAKAVPVFGERRPAAFEAPREDVRLSWRLGTADVEGKWGWHHVDNGTGLYLKSKLAAFETMTWGELAASRNNKRIPVENICGEAQERLRHLKRDDVTDLWELRLTGEQRIWGWRVGDVMHLLWWDPRHEVCPSQKKRT